MIRMKAKIVHPLMAGTPSTLPQVGVPGTLFQVTPRTILTDLGRFAPFNLSERFREAEASQSIRVHRRLNKTDVWGTLRCKCIQTIYAPFYYDIPALGFRLLRQPDLEPYPYF